MPTAPGVVSRNTSVCASTGQITNLWASARKSEQNEMAVNPEHKQSLICRMAVPSVCERPFWRVERLPHATPLRHFIAATLPQ